MSWPLVKVRDIAAQIRGVTYDKNESSKSPSPESLPVLRANNITDSGLAFEDLVYVPSRRVSPRQILQMGDVLIAASSGSLDVVGKAASVKRPFTGSFGAFCKVLRPLEKVDPSYFAHFFLTPSYRRRISSLAEGANINNLKNEHLDDLAIPLPPLGEQRRIAAIMDQAEELRAKRRAAIALLDQLPQTIFLEMFGDPATNPRQWPNTAKIADIAELVSGITKGRKVNGKPVREIPYLAVINVQDRRLWLETVKTIQATEDEIERYRLQPGDLLLTEGGDPDKLGRGALWAGELNEAIHQNHVFRVRLTSPTILPQYLLFLIGSAYGKGYFLRQAKQTTGIASINMGQLKAFPLLMPPLGLQSQFRERIEAAESAKAAHSAALAELEALFESLQAKAFGRGI